MPLCILIIENFKLYEESLRFYGQLAYFMRADNE